METLTFKQFCRRYGPMIDERARKWIAEGTAPAKKIGSKYQILVEWCDAYDRGEPGFWERATPAPEPVVTSPYLRRIGA